jgi:hypothetical protein
MACKRSAVRSRLAPPAFTSVATFGAASHARSIATKPDNVAASKITARICAEAVVMLNGVTVLRNPARTTYDD